MVVQENLSGNEKVVIIKCSMLMVFVSLLLYGGFL